MLSSGSLRRALAATAAAGIAAGLVALPNAAQAAVQAQYEASVSAQARYTGSTSGANCWNSSSASDQSKSSTLQTFTSGTHHASESMTATFTNTTNPSDSVTLAGHVSSTLTVVKSGKDLKSFALSASGNMSVSHTLLTGSQCTAVGNAFGATSIEFTEHSPGLLNISRIQRKNAIGLIEIINVATQDAVAVDLGLTSSGHSTGTAFLPKGTYEMIEGIAGIDLGGDLSLRNASASRSAPIVATVSASFVKGGSAVGPASGAATHYVVFPSSVSCSSSSASLQWTGAAGKAASGVFLVNGKQKASTQAPFPGQKVSVKVPSSSTAKITAKVKLKSGSTVTASRSYYACKG